MVDYHWDWGDGTIDDAPTAGDSHTYAGPGAYTVRLVVHDSQNGQSAPVGQTVTVAAAPPPPVTSTTSTTTATGTTPAPPPVAAPAVVATFARQATRRGQVAVSVSCPTGQTRCSGTIRLDTAKLALGRTTFRLARRAAQDRAPRS